MQPTESIVALAKEFHELGGTKGIDIVYGRWYVDPGLKNPCLWGGLNPLISDECYPILDASELESILWAQGYYKINRDFKGYYLQKHNDSTGAWDVISVDIEADNLHAALYAACVHAAKERKHDNV